jgi:hypothetical protein
LGPFTGGQLTAIIVALAAVVALPMIANAAIPNGNTYTACAANKNGSLRVIDPSKHQKCTTSERTITWGKVGPKGAAGVNGATGPTGAKGAAGATGSPGSIVGSACTKGTSAGTVTETVNASTGVIAFVCSIPTPTPLHFSWDNGVSTLQAIFGGTGGCSTATEACVDTTSFLPGSLINVSAGALCAAVCPNAVPFSVQYNGSGVPIEVDCFNGSGTVGVFSCAAQIVTHAADTSVAVGLVQ